jgi:hypothetical protein
MNQILARDLVSLLLKAGKQPENLLLILKSTPTPLLRHLRLANPVKTARVGPGQQWLTLRDGGRRKGKGEEGGEIHSVICFGL